MRQIVLDTETTGLELSAGHRLVEVGCVELRDRRPTGRTFHRYLCPDREVDPGALAVHGLNDAFLAGQPRFAEVAQEFIEFVTGAELIIHNASFDVGFLDMELARADRGVRALAEVCSITDTLALARRLHPGQRNSLDSLCKRYGVDNSARDLHGALLDARILVDVYLAMTGGQVALSLSSAMEARQHTPEAVRRGRSVRPNIPVVRANQHETAAHEQMLDSIAKLSGGRVIFRGGASS
ncbi:MAG: DNA polymerase III subunit epsilon [Steroidobacteraceae bacterium]